MENESKRSLIEEEAEISEIQEERADARELQSASIAYPSLNPSVVSPPSTLHSTKKVVEKEAAASNTEKVKKDDILSPKTHLVEAPQSSLFIRQIEQSCSSGNVHVESENFVTISERNHVTLAHTGSHKMNEMSSQSIFSDQHWTKTPTTDYFIPITAVLPQKEKLRCSTNDTSTEDDLSAEASTQPTSPKDADTDRETLVSTENFPGIKCSGAPFRDVSDVATAVLPKEKVLLLQDRQKVDLSVMGLADPTEAGAPRNEKNVDNNRGTNLQKGICFS